METRRQKLESGSLASECAAMLQLAITVTGPKQNHIQDVLNQIMIWDNHPHNKKGQKFLKSIITAALTQRAARAPNYRHGKRVFRLCTHCILPSNQVKNYTSLRYTSDIRKGFYYSKESKQLPPPSISIFLFAHIGTTEVRECLSNFSSTTAFSHLYTSTTQHEKKKKSDMTDGAV